MWPKAANVCSHTSGASTSTPQVGNSSQELQSSHLSTESEGPQGLQDSVDVAMDYSTAGWDKDPEDEALQSTKLFKVEEKTEKFLGTHFSTATAKEAVEREVRGPQHHPCSRRGQQ